MIFPSETPVELPFSGASAGSACKVAPAGTDDGVVIDEAEGEVAGGAVTEFTG